MGRYFPLLSENKYSWNTWSREHRLHCWWCIKALWDFFLCRSWRLWWPSTMWALHSNLAAPAPASQAASPPAKASASTTWKRFFWCLRLGTAEWWHSVTHWVVLWYHSLLHSLLLFLVIKQVNIWGFRSTSFYFVPAPCFSAWPLHVPCKLKILVRLPILHLTPALVASA